MKKIEAFIRHEALEAIHDRLATMGLPSMSVTEVKGSGRQKGFTESYRGAKTTIFLRPKLKLEMVVDDADVDRAIDTHPRARPHGRAGGREDLHPRPWRSRSGSARASAATWCSRRTRRRRPPSGHRPPRRFCNRARASPRRARAPSSPGK